ncbi:unnamed protein product [Amoebophrya sp. A25]|nr:unnamed protein product [Amoebophrya sp. A25]|eukprot:GSA25T00015401001.1
MRRRNGRNGLTTTTRKVRGILETEEAPLQDYAPVQDHASSWFAAQGNW